MQTATESQAAAATAARSLSAVKIKRKSIQKKYPQSPRVGNQEGSLARSLRVCVYFLFLLLVRLVFCLSSFKFPDVQCVVAPAEAEGFDKKFFGKCFLKSFTPSQTHTSHCSGSSSSSLAYKWHV